MSAAISRHKPISYFFAIAPKMHLLWHSRLLVFLCMLISCMGMFAKRAHRKHEEHEPPHKKLRVVVADAFLSNKIDAQTMREVFELEQQSGVPGFGKLAKAGNSGKSSSHTSRDLRRQLLRESKWPAFYYAPVRCWNAKKQVVVTYMLPFLLPHEVLAQLFARAINPDKMKCEANMSRAAQKHLEFAKQELQQPGLIGLGLWGDGCPTKFDRSQSLEVFCWSMPGTNDEKLKNMRIPICAVHKHFCCSEETLDDMVEVISWSFKCLAQGLMPGQRHDGSAWKPSDAQRRKTVGREIPTAVLVELRADCFVFERLL